MNRISGVILIAATVALLTGCPPRYPICKIDEHCEEKDEVCVNGQCQQCRDDSNCLANFICHNYRCVPKPECTSNAECSLPLVCRNQKCVSVAECHSDYDCKENHQCIDGKCMFKSLAESRYALPSASKCMPRTINFDFDDYSLRPDARAILDRNAECLKKRLTVKVSIEGNCDERGTTEYNYALGDMRANAAKTYLRNLGIDSTKMNTLSYGEDRPADAGHNENAWARNRRAEFIIFEP